MVNSIDKKYPQLSLFIENLLSKNAGFSVITLQEARIYDETYKKIDKVTVTDSYQIPGYNMFTQGSNFATGGLITYVRDDLTGTLRTNLETKTDLFEAQFIEVSGPLIKGKKLTIGNVYRPPKNNENLTVMARFLSQLQPLVNKLRNENSFSFLTGDFNLNLLKVGDKTAYTEFFEFMTSKDFVPMITLPTRFDKKTCSLLDHIWLNKPSKGALDPAKSSSRVLLKKIGLSDHLPCLLSLDVLEKKTHPPKFISCQKIDELGKANFRIDLVRANIEAQIDHSIEANPEQTYEKIRNILGTACNTNFPVIKKIFQRHKHKIQPWMTNEIMA